MLLVFDSRTGNVKKFVSKLKLKSVQINDGLIINEPFILITYTTGFGQIPLLTNEFLKNNNYFLAGVVSSGNRNWGQNFGKSADYIANQYKVPILHKFELSGTLSDVEFVLQKYNDLVKEKTLSY